MLFLNALRAAAIAGVATLALAAPALAADPPPQSGCPTSNQVLSVAELTAQGYRVPAQIDAAGNGNGLVCGKPLSASAQEQFCRMNGGCSVEIIYRFGDDEIAQ